ncbi:hypothetical protein LSAT2_013285, partial [Lamellibrachia satsuma]
SVQLHPYGRPAAPLRASSCTPTGVQLHPYDRPAAPLRASSCTPTGVQLHPYGRPAQRVKAKRLLNSAVWFSNRLVTDSVSGECRASVAPSCYID